MLQVRQLSCKGLTIQCLRFLTGYIHLLDGHISQYAQWRRHDMLLFTCQNSDSFSIILIISFLRVLLSPLLVCNEISQLSSAQALDRRRCLLLLVLHYHGYTLAYVAPINLRLLTVLIHKLYW